MTGFGGFDNSTSKGLLTKLERFICNFWKIEVERVAVIKFSVNSRVGRGTGCREIKI